MKAVHVILFIVLCIFLSLAWTAWRGRVYLQQFRTTAPSITVDLEKALQEKNVVPVVVIGSGPAGLSAALYAARSALYTVVFQGKTPGGQLTGTTYVENWPGTQKLLGSQLIDQNKKQAESFGAILVDDTVTEVDFSQWPYRLKTEEGHEIKALTVIIATGANPKLLSDARPVKGEKEFWGHGVTTCAVCDAPFYKDKKVVVVGGGDSAVEEATLLTAYAQEVTMIVRGTKLRAAPAMQARIAESPKISVIYSTEIEEIIGKDTHVTAVRLINTQDKKTSEMKTDGVFLAIGHRPNTEIFKKFITVDSDGYIELTTRSQKTSLPGVFSAGDVSDKTYRQAGVAAGDGIKAALDALAFLQEHGYNEKFVQKLESHYYDAYSSTIPMTFEKLATNKDFDVLAAKHPFFVLDVGADYCASCKTLLPVVKSVAAQLEGKAYFAQIDLGDDPKQLVKRFGISAIPTILVFKKGKLVARYDQQLFAKKELASILQKLIAA